MWSVTRRLASVVRARAPGVTAGRNTKDGELNSCCRFPVLVRPEIEGPFITNAFSPVRYVVDLPIYFQRCQCRDAPVQFDAPKAARWAGR